MAESSEARVKRLLKEIPRSKHEQARELAEHAAAMEEKLAETREKIWGMDIIIPYDNGGGQMGIRENPAYKAYESLLSSYQRVLKQISELKEEKKTQSLFDWIK